MPNLLQFAIKRFVAMIVVVYLIATIVFFLAHASPYDPIRLEMGQHFAGNPQGYANARHLFGLDQSLPQQYVTFMGGLLHGHLGYSEGTDTFGTPVWDLLQHGVPVSMKLGGLALLLSLLIGLPVGLMSALRQNTILDHGPQSVMMILFAVPAYVLAPLAQIIFAVTLHWLPVSGWGDPGVQGIKELILPVSVFAAGLTGFFAKSFRSFMLEVLRQDYIRTARAKGLQERLVIYLHAFKNTLLPLASIVGPVLAFLIVGAFIIELFFAVPGIGYDTVAAVTGADYGVIEGTTIMLAAFVIFVNFLTDIFYALVDPRVRY